MSLTEPLPQINVTVRISDSLAVSTFDASDEMPRESISSILGCLRKGTHVMSGRVNLFDFAPSTSPSGIRSLPHSRCWSHREPSVKVPLLVLPSPTEKQQHTSCSIFSFRDPTLCSQQERPPSATLSNPPSC